MNKPSDGDIVRFVMGFIGQSKQSRSSYVGSWQETLNNYLVLPHSGTGSGSTNNPLDLGKSKRRRFSSLKDPETKQVVDTLLAKLMLALFGEDNFVAAKKVGREDAVKADTATRLLGYSFRLDGHYRAMQTWLLDMLLFGTGICQLGWRLDERPKTFRDIIGVDEFGNEIREEYRASDHPYYDDIRLTTVDIMDFYPDFGVDNFRDMLGAAKRCEMTGYDAMKKASKGLYDMQAVKAAIAAAATATKTNDVDSLHRPERPNNVSRDPGFEIFEAYEYYGEVPFAYPDGERWRVITVANNQVLRDRPWFFDDYRLPFYDATISPIQGRLYGLSPAEGARFQQDFADFLLMMMADSVVRTVHPPILFDRDAGVDAAALAAWGPDRPIGVNGRIPQQSVQTLQYSPNLQNGFAMFNAIKQSMKENTAALGSIQGQGLGVNRASATEAERTFQMALDRPEMFARFLERECFPPLGRGILKLYQSNLETTSELIDRIGELPESAVLADIQGDFDVQFIGSRNHMSLYKRMQAIQTIVSMATIPEIGMRIDWDEIVIQILEGNGFDTIAQKLADPEKLALNMILRGFGNGRQLLGNGNGTVPAVSDAETPAEDAGQILE